MTFQNFIVLGLIPGTHVQITFQLWLQVITMLGTLLLGWQLLRHHKTLTIFILGLYVRHIIRNRELTFSSVVS